jgi:POLQ-like helicase
MMGKSSKALAKDWRYGRRTDFEREMRHTATRYFEEKGLPVQKRYSFILAEWEMWPKNIICPEVAGYIQGEKERAFAEKKPYPLHKYIHHGLSSQALLFNLVGPLIVRNDIDPIRAAFEARGVPWPEGQVQASFEMEDRKVFNEQAAQPTSIDLVVKNEGSGNWLFVESKFTENAFGGCSLVERGDCEGKNPAADFSSCYLHHIGRKYWTQMQEHKLLDGPLSSSPFCPLANYYQFFREVLFAIHYGGYFVLLYDERNTAFVATAEGLPDRGIYPLMAALLPEHLKTRVKNITIQEIFAQVRNSARHADWTAEFARKYDM